VLELLLIDVALCALLVMVAGGIMLGRRRRRRNRALMPAGEWLGTAAEPAGDGTAERETAVVPGFGDDPAESGLEAGAPAEPEQAAQPRASGLTGPPASVNGAGAEPAGPVVTGPSASPNGAGAKPAGQQAAAGDAAASDPIGSYYDEADRAMSDYLAARGWTDEPGTHRTG
jgi:hypothetical protein